ncbi:MAG: glycosyltransferase [Chloroflexi bacterium]|uniref:Glycosyltransferase n=1 Tax=Candidatus Chlorohelix allophototropha TaxID=3003348 RepID=A0A8T7LR43_9CHLR|nr:glycosyltransferase [Chloroflexota bacterium]WJW66397.1 glycosyltransferase [Chloroflexota bacterium L227-S17]
MIDLSVVIVSYNVATLLEDCLNSLYTDVPEGISLEVVVVDNASHDGSVELVKQKFPQVFVIPNSENYGFPVACNQGWQRTNGNYVFFLNPDARLEPGAISTLLTFMEQHPRAGICGPLLRYGDGSLQSNRRRFPSFKLALIESTVLQRYKPFKNLSLLKRYYFEDVPLNFARPQEVDWLVGAAFIVRRAILEQLGGFDERFFMYSEEMDLCRRVKSAGWEVWFEPRAAVTHLEGRSSAQDVPRRHINFNTSKASYFRKHHGMVIGWALRQYLLMTYRYQFLEEGAKLLVRHKPQLRRERLSLIRAVLATRLLPSKFPRPSFSKGLCLLSAEFPPQPGGVGDYTACLASELAQVASVRVLTGVRGKEEQLVAQTYRVVRPIKVWNWGSLRQVASYLEQYPADVLNIQYQSGAYELHPAVNFLPLYLKRKLGRNCPLIVTTFHDLREPYLFPKAGKVRSWVNLRLMKDSDVAVVTNEEDYHNALEGGVTASHLKLIPIGSNITPLEPLIEAEKKAERGKWGAGEDDFLVGYFGLLNHSKGVDNLLDALSLLKNEKGWKLVIIGGSTGETDVTNHPYALQLFAQIERLGLAEYIHWTGYLSSSETSRALYALDAVAFPFRDGVSLRRGSLMAALAHGIPVLTTNRNSASEAWLTNSLAYDNIREALSLLDNSVLSVALENPTALAEALRKLRTEPDLRASLSSHALAFSRHFDWQTIAKSFLEVFSAC